jgi:hypothetical protein
VAGAGIYGLFIARAGAAGLPAPTCKFGGIADDGPAIDSTELPKGGTMKKFAILLVAAAFAATPAVAAHKKKAKTDDTFAKQSANTARILRDGLPLVLPSWSLPIYFGTHMDQPAKTAKKSSKKKKM